jgi:DUF2075 family protein
MNKDTDSVSALWFGTVAQFCPLAQNHEIADTLTYSYAQRLHVPPEASLYRSWDRSLCAMAEVLVKAHIPDCQIALEYFLPGISLRPDVLLFGKSKPALGAKGKRSSRWSLVVIELKQWSEIKKLNDSQVKVNFKDWSSERDNPYQQLDFYVNYLRSLIEKSKVRIKGACLDLLYKPYLFLHNQRRAKAPDFTKDEKETQAQTFYQEDYDAFAQSLSADFGGGPEPKIWERLQRYDFPPTSGLLTKVFSEEEQLDQFSDFQELNSYVLTLTQKKIYNAITKTVLQSEAKPRSFLVTGGPGTGKTLIALKLFAFAKMNDLSVAYVVGSKILHANLTRIFPREKQDIHYTNAFSNTELSGSHFRLTIVDEAHRIRRTSRSNQIKDIVERSAVTVFFLDEDQCISRNGIGSVSEMKQSIQEVSTIQETERLPGQFRCCGDTCYIEWLKGALGYDKTEPFYRKPGSLFHFEIVDRPEDVIPALEQKPYIKNGSTDYRLLCGADHHQKTLTFPNHPDFSLPVFLNDKKEESTIWGTSLATTQDIHSVGNAYTSQGLDFGYVGVFFGDDYVFRDGKWKLKDNSESADEQNGDLFISAKNAYWVLLTRGVFGCVIYFADPETKAHFLSLGATKI